MLQTLLTKSMEQEMPRLDTKLSTSLFLEVRKMSPNLDRATKIKIAELLKDKEWQCLYDLLVEVNGPLTKKRN